MNDPLDILTLEEYVGPHAASPDWTEDRIKAAQVLVLAVNGLGDEMQAAGVYFPVNPYTGSRVSGKWYGGFRPQNCPEGAAHSAHKEGCAVDLADPKGELDAWLSDHPDALERHNLYRESPEDTLHWLHLSTRAPKSGLRTFKP
mgnify:FL=1